MGGKKFKIWSSVFCHLCNNITWPIGLKKEALLTAKNLENQAENTPKSYTSMCRQSKSKKHDVITLENPKCISPPVVPRACQWYIFSEFLKLNFYFYISYLITDISSCRISAYRQGLIGPEAAWVNWKYHGHRTLPPDMAMKLKKEHEMKYSGQESNVP